MSEPLTKQQPFIEIDRGSQFAPGKVAQKLARYADYFQPSQSRPLYKRKHRPSIDASGERLA